MSPSRLFSLHRSVVIATNTFTQLVRMKVFYFLAAFAVLLIGANFFELPFTAGPDIAAEQILTTIKSWAFGGMTLFSTIFAIVGTALLIPKDVEDRTLYTILAKPVPRLDYLVGKLGGILLLIFVSLVVMDVLTVVMLEVRMNGIVTDAAKALRTRGADEATIDVFRQSMASQGPTWVMQAGILAIFFKAAVIASVAMLVSTFSTSTLFTVIMSTLIYFIGHVQADAREYWQTFGEEGVSVFGKVGAGIVAIIFPDFQLFNIIDAAVNSQPITGIVVMQLFGLSFFYIAIYTVISWFIFSDKEF